MESTMSTCAESPVAAPTMLSTQVSAMSRAVAASSPKRRARSATCFSDSSPVAYKHRAGRVSAQPQPAASAWICRFRDRRQSRSRSPARVRRPNTRSSSAEARGQARSFSRRLNPPMRQRRRFAHVFASLALRGFAAWSSATRVFHSPQVAHCPLPFRRGSPATLTHEHLFRLSPWASFARICEFRIAGIVARSPILPGLLTRIMSIGMRKFWTDRSDCLASGSLQLACCSDCLPAAPSLTWLWMPGAGLLAAGRRAVFSGLAWGKSGPAVPMPSPKTRGRQRYRTACSTTSNSGFAELKGRKPTADRSRRSVRPREPVGAAQPHTTGHGGLPAFGSIRQHLQGRGPRA